MRHTFLALLAAALPILDTAVRHHIALCRNIHDDVRRDAAIFYVLVTTVRLQFAVFRFFATTVLFFLLVLCIVDRHCLGTAVRLYSVDLHVRRSATDIALVLFFAAGLGFFFLGGQGPVKDDVWLVADTIAGI
jgi:hypothetical protein